MPTNALKTMVLALAGMVLIFLGVGSMLPDQWHVEASRVIQAPPAKVVALLQDFQTWEKWSSLKAEMGAGTQRVVSGTPGTVGHRVTWTGPHGTAMLTVASIDAESLTYDFHIQVPPAPEPQRKGQGRLRWVAEGDGCRVTWRDDGTWDGLALRWFGWYGALQEQVKQVQGTSLAGLQREFEEANPPAGAAPKGAAPQSK